MPLSALLSADCLTVPKLQSSYSALCPVPVLSAVVTNNQIHIQIYFSKMQDKYATTTLRIVEHRHKNMAKPEGLKPATLTVLT